jgi:hypothetical protein
VFRLQFSRLFLVLGLFLLLSWDVAHARAVLEFTDGRKITVSNYEDIGQAIKVYTSNGSFAFRKKDIARIIDQESPPPTRSVQVPVDTPLPLPRPKEERPTTSSLTTPRTASHDALPSLPGWDEAADLVMEGLYRARFFVALFVGLKLLQFFLPTSFH